MARPGNVHFCSFILRTIHGDHQKFISTYFAPYPGFYFTGDRGFRDSDGYFWVRGRVDDVINVSGHRLSTAEIEAAVCKHDSCSEAAVLGKPDDITGQSIWVFCIVKHGLPDFPASSALKREIVALVRSSIGPFATPSGIVFVDDLPKTRSGKIMRRILRKLLVGDDNLGDLSSLNNPSVIEHLRGRILEA